LGERDLGIPFLKELKRKITGRIGLIDAIARHDERLSTAGSLTNSAQKLPTRL
jgi:hypothetical protein